MNDISVIGKRTPKVDSLEKAKGSAQYTGDICLPGLLYGKILRSPLPHARILNVDTTRAKRLVGVKAVIAGQDTLGVKVGGIRSMPEFKDRQGICVDKVRYIGDTVAAVAAVDEDTAEEALSLIRVEYAELPAVFDPFEAMTSDAPLLHEQAPGNISMKIVIEAGNVEEALSNAYHVREDVFSTQPVNHCYLEPHSALAQFTSNGKLTIWTSTQAPFHVRKELAETLGLLDENIRVIKPHVGGAFGGKLDGMDAADFCAAVLAKASRHPVRVVYERSDEFIAARRRHPAIIKVRTGVNRDGTLSGRDSKMILDGGAYNGVGQAVCIQGGARQLLPYRLPNSRYEGLRVYTNKAPSGAMRGFGIPQMHFGIEVQLDMIAEDLGLDPAEIRLRNALRTGDRNPRGYYIGSSGFAECISEATEHVIWKEKRGRLHFGKGVGLGCSGFPCGVPMMQFPAPTFSSARVEYNSDGTVTVLTAASDIGQGSDTLFTQIAVQELGVRFEDVKILSGDTGLGQTDQGSFSSRVTMMAGNAVKRASINARRKLFQEVADKLEVNDDDLELVNGRVQVRGCPDRSLSLVEAINLAKVHRGSSAVFGEGSYDPPSMEVQASPAFSFEAQAMEIDVDTETGQIRVVDSVIAHDCGKTLNPLVVEGQLEGSVVMGMGYALSEQVLVEDGRTLNPSLGQYGIPTSLEVPPISCVTVDGIDDPAGPYGAKEAGEGTMAPFAPALVSAVYDAIGVRIKDLPITPDKILRALEEKAQNLS